MFSSQERLVKRSGKTGIDRPQYLKELIEEFNKTESYDAKEQVLANLANFSYDPINYSWLRQLRVIDLFLEQLTGETVTLQEFAAAGLCNLALDFENKAYIIQQGGIALLTKCLSVKQEELILSALTTLMFLVTPQSKTEITSRSTIRKVLQLASSDKKRIINLATIFLTDYCTSEQIELAKEDTS